MGQREGKNFKCLHCGHFPHADGIPHISIRYSQMYRKADLIHLNRQL